MSIDIAGPPPDDVECGGSTWGAILDKEISERASTLTAYIPCSVISAEPSDGARCEPDPSDGRRWTTSYLPPRCSAESVFAVRPLWAEDTVLPCWTGTSSCLSSEGSDMEEGFMSSTLLKGGAGVGSLKSSGLDDVIDVWRSRRGDFVKRDHQLSGRDVVGEWDGVPEMGEYWGAQVAICGSETREVIGLWSVGEMLVGGESAACSTSPKVICPQEGSCIDGSELEGSKRVVREASLRGVSMRERTEKGHTESWEPKLVDISSLIGVA